MTSDYDLNSKPYDSLTNAEKYAVDTYRLGRLLRLLAWLTVAALIGMFLLARMDNTKPAGAQEWCDAAGTIECPTTSTTAPVTPPPTILPPAVIYTENVPDGKCHEDDPCWDCATMGNLICGPKPVVATPAFTG